MIKAKYLSYCVVYKMKWDKADAMLRTVLAYSESQ